jgi:alcohol dehydrogenase class IV
MEFEFATANRIIFGPGTVARAPAEAAALGHRALVVVDSLERSAALLDGLREQNVTPLPHPIFGEPDQDSILQTLSAARDCRCDLVIGMGGGSALDTGKAVAALLTNPGDLFDYLEVIGKGLPLRIPSLAFIAIPTTAGTGSEVTRNAVITIPEQRVKVSLRSPVMLPRLAIVDPDLTISLPPSKTASTGMDALTQLIEPFVCTTPNPLADSACREGLSRVAHSLVKAFRNGDDRKAREDMALASLCGGIALANAKLGAVHGMANPIGGICHAPHGAICARLLPLVMETNLLALITRRSDSPSLARYTEVAQILTGNPSARAEDGVDWAKALSADLEIPPLSAFSLRQEDFPTLILQSKKANSMKGNPVPLTDEEIRSLLESAWK